MHSVALQAAAQSTLHRAHALIHQLLPSMSLTLPVDLPVPLTCALAQVIKVSGFSDAADVVLISEAYKFVQQALDSSMCAEVGSSNSGSGGESSAEEGEEPPPQGEKQVGGGSEPQQLLGLDGTEAPATPGVTSTYDSSSQGSTTAGAGVSPSNAPSFGTTKAPCACLVCISQDVRFAQVLAYATSRGLYTIALAPFRSMRPAAAAMARAQPLHSLPLARACRAAVHWVPAPQPLSLPEQLWLEECHGKLHRVWQPRVQPAEAGAAVAASGAGRDSEEACAASTPTGAVAAAPPVAWQTLEECPGSVLQVWVNPGEEQGQQQQQHGQAAARASAGPAAGRRGKVVQKGPQPRQQQGQHGQRPPAQPSRGQKQQQGRKRA